MVFLQVVGDRIQIVVRCATMSNNAKDFIFHEEPLRLCIK